MLEFPLLRDARYNQESSLKVLQPKSTQGRFIIVCHNHDINLDATLRNTGNQRKPQYWGYISNRQKLNGSKSTLNQRNAIHLASNIIDVHSLLLQSYSSFRFAISID